ncbi:restriction endonuclease subunit S [Micromonospora chersina]
MNAPAGWRSVRLGDIARVYSGGTPSRSVAAYWGGGIPWASTAEIDVPSIMSTKETISELGLANSAAKIAPAGTLLMAMYGQGKTRGKTSMLGIDAAMNQACAAIQPHAGVNRHFLLAYLRHNYEMIRGLSNAGGQENLSGEIVKKIPVVLPDAREQARIAEAWQDAAQLIDYLERLIAKKQAIKQGMVQQLLADKTRLSGWPYSRLSDLIDGLEAGVSVRSSEHASHGVSVLKTSAVAGGRFDPTEAKPVLPADVGRVRCRPVAGSLVVSRMNTPALVGEVGYVEHDYSNLYLPDRLWLACPKRGGRRTVNMRWLAYYLSSESGSRAVRELATGTSGSMKNIPKVRLLALEIPTPPPVEQNRIAEALRDADCAIDLLRDRLSKVQDVKQGMMQELLAGRTRLPVKDGAA